MYNSAQKAPGQLEPENVMMLLVCNVDPINSALIGLHAPSEEKQGSGR